MMPAKYTLATLPEPLDPNVRLREIPAQKMAAVRYSGTWSQKRYEKKRTALGQFITDQGLTVTGPATFARYRPALPALVSPAQRGPDPGRMNPISNTQAKPIHAAADSMESGHSPRVGPWSCNLPASLQ